MKSPLKIAGYAIGMIGMLLMLPIIWLANLLPDPLAEIAAFLPTVFCVGCLALGTKLGANFTSDPYHEQKRRQRKERMRAKQS